MVRASAGRAVPQARTHRARGRRHPRGARRAEGRLMAMRVLPDPPPAPVVALAPSSPRFDALKFLRAVVTGGAGGAGKVEMTAVQLSVLTALVLRANAEAECWPSRS